MKKEDLDSQYGLYKTIDLLKDTRVNVFCKAGGGFIFFTLFVIGFFIDNMNLLFPFSQGYLLFVQYLSLIVGFILYALFHELIHFLMARIMKIHAKMKPAGLFPYCTIEEELLSKKQYILFALMPFISLTTLLIPSVILVKIFAPNWFWLPYILLMQDAATSVGDFVAIFYIKRYKKCYIEDNDAQLLIYVKMDEFKEYHDSEKAYYEKKMLKKIKKKKRKEQLKNAPLMGKKKYEESLKEKGTPLEDTDAQDIDDLSKLDM